MVLHEPERVIGKLAQVFDRLGIRYVTAGSLASSRYGIPRSTQDADVVAEIGMSHVALIAGALASEFYVDAAMINEAVVSRGSFNVIHLPTMFKVDIFVSRKDERALEEMGRGEVTQVAVEGESVTIRFATAEDTLLHKLVWYRRGNEVSERQWSDVLGILKVQGQRLDNAYLDRWAARLGVADLLSRARASAPDPGP